MNNDFNFENLNVELARGISDGINQDNREGDEVFHDDGALFVHRGNETFWFNIGQEVSSSQYNREANRILHEIGVEGRVTGHNN